MDSRARGRWNATIFLSSYFNQNGQHEKALAFVAITEISALGTRGSSGAHKAPGTDLALGRRALPAGDAIGA